MQTTSTVPAATRTRLARRALAFFAILLACMFSVFAVPSAAHAVRVAECKLSMVEGVSFAAAQVYDIKHMDDPLDCLKITEQIRWAPSLDPQSQTINLLDRNNLPYEDQNVLFALGCNWTYEPTVFHGISTEVIAGSLEEPGTATIRVSFDSGEVAQKFPPRDVQLTVIDGIALASFELASDTYVYTGSAVRPEVTAVYDADGNLVDPSNYTVEYRNNTNAGSLADLGLPGVIAGPTVIVSGINDYSGILKKEFSIVPADLSNAFVQIAPQEYTGSALRPAVTVKMGAHTLQPGEIGAVTYSNNVNAGTATVTVTAMGYDPDTGKSTGSYTGVATGTFAISPAPMWKASVSGIADQVFTGRPITPNPAVSLYGRRLSQGADYTLAYTNNTREGAASIAFTGKGNYSGTKTVNFNIVLKTSTGLVGNPVNKVQYFSRFKGGMFWVSDGTRYVPGIDQTAVNGEHCSEMVPQGICVTGNYMLISAYCSSAKHDSVIYVMNRTTGALLSTLTVEGTKDLSGHGNHFGGIAYGAGYVWIATSSYPEGGTKREICIPFSTIVAKLQSGKAYASITKSEYSFSTLPGRTSEAASFNTFYGGYLWVGYFNRTGKGTLTGYRPSGTTLKLGPTFKIAKKANGAEFFEYAGRTFLAVNSSPGRHDETTLYVYSVPNLAKGGDLAASKTTLRKLDMPPMFEELCWYHDSSNPNGIMYTLSESAAYPYGLKDDDPADYVSNVIYSGCPGALVQGLKSLKDAGAVVSGVKDKTYSGKALVQALTVKINTIFGFGGTALKEGVDYSVSYKNNKDAGKATLTVKGAGIFKGSVSDTFKIAKAANPIDAKGSTAKVKLSKVKKAAQTVAGVISVSKAKGSVTYAKASGSSCLSVAKSTGKITVKKGTKKGTYTITVKVSAAGNGNYKAGSDNAKVTVKVA